MKNKLLRLWWLVAFVEGAIEFGNLVQLEEVDLQSSTYAARSQLARAARTATQRRSATTVPRFGNVDQMKKEAIEHLKARIAKQKEIEKGNHISHTDEVNEMTKWIKITFLIAVPICVLSVAKDTFLIEHPHRKTGPEPDYMRIRKKEFPWECEDCELFNGECWKKCREDKAAAAAGN